MPFGSLADALQPHVQRGVRSRSNLMCRSTPSAHPVRRLDRADREAEQALKPLLDIVAQPQEIQGIGIGLQGEIRVAEGRFDEATPFLEDALERTPANAAARIILCMNQLRLGNFAAGWPDLSIREVGAELYPNGPPANLGQLVERRRSGG